MKEIDLTPKAEEDLEAIWDYSFRQFGVILADAYIGRIAAKGSVTPDIYLDIPSFIFYINTIDAISFYINRISKK